MTIYLYIHTRARTRTYARARAHTHTNRHTQIFIYTKTDGRMDGWMNTLTQKNAYNYVNNMMREV